jgi:hypothetical protein
LVVQFSGEKKPYKKNLNGNNEQIILMEVERRPIEEQEENFF